MTRVLSGVVLGVVALRLIWFLDSIWLLSVALVVCTLAFHEYERIVDRIGAKVPYWTSLTAALLACTMVPFEWFDAGWRVAVRGSADAQSAFDGYLGVDR